MNMIKIMVFFFFFRTLNILIFEEIIKPMKKKYSSGLNLLREVKFFF